jgi:hypothetical protein
MCQQNKRTPGSMRQGAQTQLCARSVKKKKTQHTYEGHKMCWKEARVQQSEPNIIYRKYKISAHMSLLVNPISQPSVDISPIWILVISEEVGRLQQNRF